MTRISKTITNQNNKKKKKPNMLELILACDTTHRTTHIRPLGDLLLALINHRIRPVKNKLPATLRAPPGNTVMRTVNIHLATGHRVPEPVKADITHVSAMDGVEQLCRERQPFLEVFDAEEA